jgi:serine protease Do
MFKNKISYTFIIATCFGLLGGAAGAIATGAYFYKSAAGLSLFGEYRISDTGVPGANLIIRDPKKVVIEQSARIQDLSLSIKNGTFGIFKKLAEEKPAVRQAFYDLKNPAGQGLSVSSDGWIAAILPAGIKSGELAASYVIFSQEKEQFIIEKAIEDLLTGVMFIKINAKNLPIYSFAGKDSFVPGTQIGGFNWKGSVFLNSLSSPIRTSGPIKSSSAAIHAMIMNDNPAGQSFGTFLFGLNGEFMGIVDMKGKTAASLDLDQAFLSILKNGKVIRADLGVNYILLDETAGLPSKKGALISKNQESPAVKPGSPAEKAGLKEGDIILSIDNLAVGEEMEIRDILLTRLPGEILPIEIVRAGKTGRLNVKL